MEVRLDTAQQMQAFLELVQPLEVRYGYVRGVVDGDSYITYRNMATNPRIGIGNKLISEWATFIVTIQTKTAEQNLIYSALVRHATSQKNVQFVSDDFRRDVTVQNGWINTLIMRIYSTAIVEFYTQEQVRVILQEIADRYIMITSVYKKPFDESIIEKFTVPELTKEEYSPYELYELKKAYLDKYLLDITEY